MSAISLRVHARHWQNPALFAELLSMLREYRYPINEVAFFTASTHPPMPLSTIREGAELLGNEALPAVRGSGEVLNDVEHIGPQSSKIAEGINDTQ